MEALLDTGKAPDKDRSVPPPAAGSGARRRDRTSEVVERLDLHGSTLSEALLRLEAFIVRTSALDARHVLVITGRGRRSSGGVPVLRRAVAAWLRRQGRPWVAQVELAPRRLGGEGALSVRLRRPRPR